MFYVYCLISEVEPGRRYTGFPEDLKHRVLDHNRSGDVEIAVAAKGVEEVSAELASYQHKRAA
jgi:predicted GIY-YIG superfamily endonuclease